MYLPWDDSFPGGLSEFKNNSPPIWIAIFVQNCTGPNWEIPLTVFGSATTVVGTVATPSDLFLVLGTRLLE